MNIRYKVRAGTLGLQNYYNFMNCANDFVRKCAIYTKSHVTLAFIEVSLT